MRFQATTSSIAIATVLLSGTYSHAQQVPTSPPVNFTNSSTASVGSQIAGVLDDYAVLMQNNPAVMVQNYQTVVTMTQNRTTDQTLKALHDDRTAQPYSIQNGLGALTSLYLTGAAASASGVTPAGLTSTTYATSTLADYQNNINFLNGASAGSATFSNGTATPLANAVNFINNVVRNNSSTEPPKRIFERYQGANPAINPLDARYANYNVSTTPKGLSTADTANFVVPSYLSSFTVPAPYGTTANWVKGFTVTQAMIDANGGKPLTAPNLGTFDASGNLISATFGVGAYVPGIGTAPRPYRVSTAVNIPSPLYQVINSTNPYADGAFPSGHTNSGELQALGLAFLIPQQGQELLTRAADLGNDRILAGMHSPLDVIGGRMEATALAATNIYATLYDANGNRVDWTNPANTAAYATYQAVQSTQAYLSSACGTTSVAACIQAAQASGANASDPFGNAAANKAAYTAELTYGFTPIGPSTPLLASQVPIQAQVLLLTRFPYLTDAQRIEILATTGLPSGYPLLSGNTYDNWGRLNLYAAYDGYGAFNGQTAITMDASLGGYYASDSYNNDIGGAGGLTLGGTGRLTLTGKNTYTGPTIINGGTLEVAGSIVSPSTVNATGTLAGSGTVGAVQVNAGGTLAPGSLVAQTALLAGTTSVAATTLNVAGALQFASGSTLAIAATPSQASSVVATGAATITGGTVEVQAAPTGSFLPYVNYKILTASSVTGTFATASTNLPFLTAALSYDANDVFVSLNRNNVSFNAAAATPNQLAVAQTLSNTSRQPTSGAGGALLNAVFGLRSTQEARTAFDSLSGEGLVATENAGIQAAHVFSGVINDQATSLLTGGLGAVNSITMGASLPPGVLGYAPASPITSPIVLDRKLPQPRTYRVWSTGFGGGVSLTGNANIASETGDYRGGVLGLDYQVHPNILIGAAVGGSDSSFNVRSRSTSGDVTGFHGGVYSLVNFGPYYGSNSVTVSSFSNHTTRAIAGLTGFAATEKASFGSLDVRTRAEFGRVFDYGSLGGFTALKVTPFVAVEAAQLHTDGFTERNANGSTNIFGLNHRGQDTTDIPVFVGARFESAYAVGPGMMLRPMVSLAYLHEFAPQRNLENGFVSLPGSTFLVSGARPSSNAAQTKAGFELNMGHGVGFFANFDGEFSAQERGYGGKGGLQITW